MPSRYRSALGAASAAILAIAAGAFAPGGPAVAATTPTATAAGLIRVIVEYDDPDAAALAVSRAGGKVGRPLSVVNGFVAEVPSQRLSALKTAPGVRGVTVDGTVSLSAARWRADGDSNSMFSVVRATGALDVWKKLDSTGRNIAGTGVGVALIDSGVSPVTGLNDTTRIINGPDLSFESQASNLRYTDTFGHGTHMAGLIAGRDPLTNLLTVSDPSNFTGMAPNATLLSVKVAAADGATDVSQVIAGIDWVVQHRNDPGLNIKVLNLSFGTDSNQDEKLDPLSHAVESAWKKGITVVVSGGNDGTTRSNLSMPAVNPYVIAVGAADSKGTESRADDVVADFSSRGNATRSVDLTAPGRSIVGLRDPGSYVDVNYPTGLVPGDTTGRYFRGSGSSQAAAITSGAVALLLQQRPSLTPDQVKKLLTSTADVMPKAEKLGSGAGALNIKRAIDAPTPSAAAAAQSWVASTGAGSLEASRGTAHVADPTSGVELTGEKDIMGKAWNGTTWGKAATAGTAWSGGTWNGAAWTGTSMSTGQFPGLPTAKTWSSVTWSGTNWDGRTWSGRTWSGATWDGRTWSGRTWSGNTWSGRTWSGSYWSSSIWQ
ncbi:S8 family serine peptidase [Dactylosporangium sp. NPDC000244]|uniref:S8 family serine peptidase n=1 Tax=Dactylosporangium sp. NPDC000244 TaxID=3154365 RepID=UPI0033204D23